MCKSVSGKIFSNTTDQNKFSTRLSKRLKKSTCILVEKILLTVKKCE